MKKFRKFTALCLSVVMAFSLMSVGASANNDILSTKHGVTPEMIEYDQMALAQIEENLDKIHEEIEEYQSNIVSPRGVLHNGFQYLDGDILVTKSTSVGGLTGHVGIIVGDKVLEITSKYNNGLPAAIPLSTWYTRYPTTIVMRYTDGRTIPVNAAWYGQTWYVDGDGSDNTYSILGIITAQNTDYCSSLVWKCYHFGAGFDFLTYHDSPSFTGMKVPGTIYPYDYINYGNYNGFTAVHSVNW